MHTQSVERWQHPHVFLGERHDRHARRTWLVVGLTAAMMTIEIVGGMIFGSMAVVADGWHMATHAGALGMTAAAYRFARTHRHDPRFTFGTGKVGELAGFGSAVILGIVAILIGVESAQRLIAPVAIAFNEAIAIAVVGLAVNLASVLILRDDSHGHSHAHPAHEHSHHRPHHHDGHDSNLRAAYLHVAADALTSVLAIAALVGASIFGWVWMDPAVGILGAVVIATWSIGLIRSSGATLLDMVPDPSLAGRIAERLEVGGDRVSDLHIWRVGPGHVAAVVSVVSDHPRDPSAYKDRLHGMPQLSHVTVEVHRCGAPLRPAA